MKHIKRIADIKKQAQPKRPLITFALLSVAVGLFVYGCIFFINKKQATDKPAKPITQGVLTNSTDEPEENIPNCDSFKVADSVPRKIDLPTIKSSGCIIQVGVDQKSAIAVPNNIHLAGWFVGSTPPGVPGVSIINGHVSGRYNPGIFKDLDKLKQRDQFTVEFGNGSKKTFEVVSVNTYSVSETTQKMYDKAQDIEGQLNLITCGGQFNKDSRQYDRRVLVITKML